MSISAFEREMKLMNIINIVKAVLPATSECALPVKCEKTKD